MQIDFFKPAFMDDVLDLVTRPDQVREASITLLQQCRRGSRDTTLEKLFGIDD